MIMKQETNENDLLGIKTLRASGNFASVAEANGDCRYQEEMLVLQDLFKRPLKGEETYHDRANTAATMLTNNKRLIDSSSIAGIRTLLHQTKNSELITHSDHYTQKVAQRLEDAMTTANEEPPPRTQDPILDRAVL